MILDAVNALLGRIHLASDLCRLDGAETDLLREAVGYARALAPVRERATPYLPLGYAKHGDPAVATGLLTREKLFLAVWNLEDGERTVTVPLGGVRPAAVTVGYPKAGGEAVGFSLDGGALTVRFPHGPMARLFEITLGSGV